MQNYISRRKVKILTGQVNVRALDRVSELRAQYPSYYRDSNPSPSVNQGCIRRVINVIQCYCSFMRNAGAYIYKFSDMCHNFSFHSQFPIISFRGL